MSQNGAEGLKMAERMFNVSQNGAEGLKMAEQMFNISQNGAEGLKMAERMSKLIIASIGPKLQRGSQKNWRNTFWKTDEIYPL
jgi:hypothetical protein